MILALALLASDPLPDNCEWVKKPVPHVAKAWKPLPLVSKLIQPKKPHKRKEEMDITCKDVLPPVGLSVVEMSVEPMESIEPVALEVPRAPVVTAEGDVVPATEALSSPTFSSYSYTAPLYIDTAISFRAVPAVPEVPSWVLLIAGLILFPAIKRRKEA